MTHYCFDPAQLVQSYPRGSKALRGAFSRFQPQDTVAWFKQHGVLLKREADGRMFPVTDDSATIVDCLMQAALQAGVRLKTRAPVGQVRQTQAGFELSVKSGGQDGRTDFAHRLLLATGSSPQGYRIAHSLGHTLEPPVPSLFTFNVPDQALHELSGLTVDPVVLKLKVAQKTLAQTGPLLITHWGFSGPAILKLSAWGARLLHEQRYQAILQINWLPALTQEQVRAELLQAKETWGKRGLPTAPLFSLPKRLWHYLIARSGIDPELTWAHLAKAALNRLVQELTQGQYAIAGKGAFKDEFVTCGGIRLQEVDFKTMESRICPGLYFAGEILDIDGITGGFNFQSAWTTGWLAGRAMVKDLP